MQNFVAFSEYMNFNEKSQFQGGIQILTLFLLGDKCTNAEKELTDTKEVLNALKSDNVSTKKALQGIYFPIFLLSFTLIKLPTVVHSGIKIKPQWFIGVLKVQIYIIKGSNLYDF